MLSYTLIKEQIQDAWFQQNFSNDGQRFVAWYLRNIHQRDQLQTTGDMIDGPGDKQIDAVVVDEDESIIYIIQGKFDSGETIDAKPVREIITAWLQLRNLEQLQSTCNPRLQCKITDIARAIDDGCKICFELVTTATLTDVAKNDLEMFQRTLAELSENEDWDATVSLVDKEELARKYDLVLEKDNPVINYSLPLAECKYFPTTIAGTQVVLAAVPLKSCLDFPGIQSGTLFQKNVRQSLASNNKVNKAIRQTIRGTSHKDFFFFHNGITAICNQMNITDGNLNMQSLSVVNGCQSLHAILDCSETVKKLEDTFIMCRFYEIPQRDRADKISTNTNSQSAVKPRDLRSNDNRVLKLKRTFEQKYPTGYFITKRGEGVPGNTNPDYVLDISQLAKYLISWHSQRPNIAYGETKLFDKYFDVLFNRKRKYNPEDALALHSWMREINKVWEPRNPLGFNDTLLRMKAYAPNVHLYAVSAYFMIFNDKSEKVPSPSKSLESAKQHGLIDKIVERAGRSLNAALEEAASKPQKDSVFSPHNWIKAKQCLEDIHTFVRHFFKHTLPELSDHEAQQVKGGLTLKLEDFEPRWTADFD